MRYISGLVVLLWFPVWSAFGAPACEHFDWPGACSYFDRYLALDEGVGFKVLVVRRQEPPSIGLAVQGSYAAAAAEALSTCRNRFSSGQPLQGCEVTAVGGDYIGDLPEAVRAERIALYRRTQMRAAAALLASEPGIRGHAMPVWAERSRGAKERELYVAALSFHKAGEGNARIVAASADGTLCAGLAWRQSVSTLRRKSRLLRTATGHLFLRCPGSDVMFGTYRFSKTGGYAQLLDADNHMLRMVFGASLLSAEPDPSRFEGAWQRARREAAAPAREPEPGAVARRKLAEMLGVLGFGGTLAEASAAYGHLVALPIDDGTPSAAIDGVLAGAVGLDLTELPAPGAQPDITVPEPSEVADLTERQAALAVPEAKAAARSSAATAPQRSSAGPSCAGSATEIYAQVGRSVVTVLALFVDPYRATRRFEIGTGSGVVFDARGHVVTNAHVVHGAQKTLLRTATGDTLDVKLVGSDPLTDIAVLRYDRQSRLGDPLTFRTSRAVAIGEEVLAIGSPLGLEATATRGIVSGLERDISPSVVGWRAPLIQTDAAINPGNSGGPLVDMCGEVVGINSMAAREAENLGFAIPARVAARVASSLIENGRVIRPWHGVYGRLTSGLLRNLITSVDVYGLLVETVEPGSPAEKLGLRGGELPLRIGRQDYLLGGDIITSVNGIQLLSVDSLERALGSLAVGQRVKLVYVRDSDPKPRTASIELPERPLLDGDAWWLKRAPEKH